jgi:4-amino-4-deoxy-L-arabinose transferase-like glycosyltransferase
VGPPDAVIVLALTALSLGCFVAFFVGLRGGRPTFWNDTYEYAQVARNVANGTGLRTNGATVYEVFFIKPAEVPPPYYLHDVGNSLSMGTLFRLVGARNQVIAWHSGAFFVLIAPLIYLLGRQLFERTVGVLAAILVSLNPALLVFSTTGYVEVPTALLLTLVFYMALLARTRTRSFATGVVYGLYVLFRSSGLSLLPWLALFLAARSRPQDGGPWRIRLRAAGACVLPFLGGLLLVLGPNAARNRYWTGSFLHTTGSSALLHLTSGMEGKTAHRLWSPGGDVDPLAFAVAHPEEIAGKVLPQLTETAGHFLDGGLSWQRDWTSSAYLLLFVVAVAVRAPEETREGRHLRWLVLAGFLTALLVGSLFFLRWRHLYCFLPVMILWASALLVRATRGARRLLPLTLAAGVLIAYGINPLLASVGPEDGHRDRNRFFRNLASFVRENTPKDALVFLDASAAGGFSGIGNALAWYSERVVVQYHELTVAGLGRTSTRPVFAVRVDTGMRPGGPTGLAQDPRFHRRAEWSGNVGEASLFGRTRGEAALYRLGE